ncbi:MAG: hypothetical protein ACP5MU_05545 [Thermoplasmata archaeon]
MKEFSNFSLNEGSRVKIYLRAGNDVKTLEGTFMGLSDTMQPLVYIKSGNKNFLINMLDIIYIETENNLDKVENNKKMDYLV